MKGRMRKGKNTDDYEYECYDERVRGIVSSSISGYHWPCHIAVQIT